MRERREMCEMQKHRKLSNVKIWSKPPICSTTAEESKTKEKTHINDQTIRIFEWEQRAFFSTNYSKHLLRVPNKQKKNIQQNIEWSSMKQLKVEMLIKVACCCHRCWCYWCYWCCWCCYENIERVALILSAFFFSHSTNIVCSMLQWTMCVAFAFINTMHTIEFLNTFMRFIIFNFVFFFSFASLSLPIFHTGMGYVGRARFIRSRFIFVVCRVHRFISPSIVVIVDCFRRSLSFFPATVHCTLHFQYTLVVVRNESNHSSSNVNANEIKCECCAYASALYAWMWLWRGAIYPSLFSRFGFVLVTMFACFSDK